MNLLSMSRISSEQLLSGSFGIEWESLRAKGQGELSLTPHPRIFGDKLHNPFVTTDFSESQIEIITPPFDSIDEVYDNFLLLSDLVNTSLPEDEYLWSQSIPCILPSQDQIPIAQYSGDGKSSQKYREGLAKKYGVKKQMISGVHFNFSFSNDLLRKLYLLDEEDLTFKDFKDNVYLKVVRNYMKYCWLIIYLTGCSNGFHESFTNDCIGLMDGNDGDGGYYSTEGLSFRNSSCGYKNITELYPSYDSVEEFVNDVRGFVEEKLLSEAKELYSQIRLKAKNPTDLLNSLKNDGIEYLEIRTLDINPFYQSGIAKYDMKFLHLFLIYMLIKEESNYSNWQKEAKINEDNTAQRAYQKSMRLLKDGQEVTLESWALEIINEMYEMCEVLGIDERDTLDLMLDRVENHDLTYSQKMLKLIEENGFIDTQVQLSRNNKHNSINNIRSMNLNKSEELEKYINLVLVGE
ncbi:MAG: glutamate--cysteine ligase [Methanosphaera sp. rholeuAM130]|nr:MAG: glutamate--cysteine ligase [Methanosphaera sp. rholeuAM130]